MTQDIEHILRRIAEVAEGRSRVIVAIAGPPAAGKSTVSERLAAALPDAAVLPMDGFHLDNEELEGRGLLHRKGAPQTFDTEGLMALLPRIRAGEAVAVPTFDRAADRVIPAGSHIAAETRIVLVEGNYLLLDAPDWSGMQRFWDLTIAIDVPLATLEQRLVQRWLDHGLPPDAARQRAEGNDLPNARLVLSQSVAPDVVLDQRGRG